GDYRVKGSGSEFPSLLRDIAGGCFHAIYCRSLLRKAKRWRICVGGGGGGVDVGVGSNSYGRRCVRREGALAAAVVAGGGNGSKSGSPSDISVTPTIRSSSSSSM
ncbi:unnamed protein product, partial [Ectocarpus sp. 8 AP-2014]